jgi:hypothetical protein
MPPNGKAAREYDFEEQTGALVLPAPYNNLLDPSLREAFDALGSRDPRSAVRRAVEAIHNTWSTNPTLVDLAWEHSRDPATLFDVGDSPGSFTEKIGSKMTEIGFRPRGPISQLSLFDVPAHWFISIAQGLKQMRDRIKIEACVGDVTAVLEQIKYGAVGHRKHVSCPKRRPKPYRPREHIHKSTTASISATSQITSEALSPLTYTPYKLPIPARLLTPRRPACETPRASTVLRSSMPNTSPCTNRAK